MYIQAMEIKDVASEPKDIAKSMWKFWEWQLYQKKIARNAVSGRIDNAIRQNKNSEEEWRKSDDNVGFGCGPIKPYTESQIELMKSQLVVAEKELIEMEKYTSFFIDHFISASMGVR